MRWLFSVVLGLLLAVGGYVFGVQSRGTPSGRSDGRITSGPERLRAGYVEIPAAGSQCTGKPTATVIIRLENLLDTLNFSNDPSKKGNTVQRHITFVTRDGTFDATQLPNEGQLTPQQVDGFFATRLDFSTRLRTVNGPVDLLQGQSAAVRIVLDKASNPGVEFLRPDPLRNRKDPDSAFAVMASVDTAKKNMLFCRQPIVAAGAGDGEEYVEFRLQAGRTANGSLTGPTTGSFGIGLLVRDPKEPFVTPVVLDPAIRNEG